LESIPLQKRSCIWCVVGDSVDLCFWHRPESPSVRLFLGTRPTRFLLWRILVRGV
jgi:hypothetical protein